MKTGLEGLEPPTRDFGDRRSTSELKPCVFFLSKNKPDSVVKYNVSMQAYSQHIALSRLSG